MNTFKVFLTALVLFLPFSSTSSTGLYLNLPQHIARIDTARAVLTFHEAQLSRTGGEASFLYSEVDFTVKRVLSVRLGLSYVVFDEEKEIADGVGDGFVYSTIRVMGDTLGVTGLFIRSDLRIPIGSKGLYPFSYASLDGGVGVEGRYKLPLFLLRASSTFYMCGDRIRSYGLNLDNYFINSLSLEFPLFGPADLAFSVFYVNFRGGGSRELYELALQSDLSSRFSLVAGAVLDSGGEDERIFNSLIFLSIDYRFPPVEKAEKRGDEGEGPGAVPR